jgi:glycerol-3-phosphate cytidylyltransferase
MKTLYTGGTFDLFHAGHVAFLKRCKYLADEVVVSLNTDNFVSSYKGSSPIISYEDRLTVISACRYVDKVVENIGGADSKPAILKVKPDIIAVGDDWKHKDYCEQMMFSMSWLKSNKITLIYIPYTKGISSTKIKGRING